MPSSNDAEPSSYVQGKHVKEGHGEKYKLHFRNIRPE